MGGVPPPLTLEARKFPTKQVAREIYWVDLCPHACHPSPAFLTIPENIGTPTPLLHNEPL